MHVKIGGEMRHLWRAVDHEGEVLESFVTTTRDKSEALRFMEKVMKRCGRPETVVKGESCAPAEIVCIRLTAPPFSPEIAG